MKLSFLVNPLLRIGFRYSNLKTDFLIDETQTAQLSMEISFEANKKEEIDDPVIYLPTIGNRFYS